ncbi:MAG: hypothetical protein H3C58_01810 [Fimbriimonadaceae bacterium]|nr:hypothetical protein [Fimbriimonadaceae bacterium]
MKRGSISGGLALAVTCCLSGGLVLGLGVVSSARSQAWRLEQARPSVPPNPELGTRVELRPERFLGDPPAGPLLVVLAGACSTCSSEPVQPVAGLDQESFSRVVVVVQGPPEEVAKWRERVPEPAHLYADEDGAVTAALAPRFLPRSHAVSAEGRLIGFQATPLDDPNLAFGGRS